MFKRIQQTKHDFIIHEDDDDIVFLKGLGGRALPCLTP
jgi:hypothetical protein